MALTALGQRSRLLYEKMDLSKEKTTISEPMWDTEHGSLLSKGYLLQDRYVIEDELGAGGFGITYLGKHRYLEDKWVAIKEYMPDGAATRDSGSRVHVISERYSKMYLWGLHRFLDEARMLHKFKHTNIVSVQDFFEANNTAYLVMDYIRGRSLQTMLDAGRVLDEKKLRSIVYPLLDALRCIHREGLFHRDISPDNILLREEDDTPVLIDFGSARYAMRMHGAEKVTGGQDHRPTAIFKEGYSPIEQYEGGDQGPYTDIYSLGATLYRAAFGSRPPDALKRSGELRRKKKDPLEPASKKGEGKFTQAFLQAIDAALQLEAEDRPQTIDEWLNILGKPSQTETPAPSPPSLRPSWRNKAVVAAIVLAGAAALLSLFAIESPPSKEDVPELLSQAAAVLEKTPFSDQGLSEARNLYFQVLTLDQENARALSGYRATKLLKQFSNAIEEENLRDAMILLDNAKTVLQKTGIDTNVLTPYRQQVKLLKSKASLRAAISRQPLSPKTWPDISLLLDEMATLQDGKPLAEAGRHGLELLKATNAAVQKSNFDAAWSHLTDAERQLAPLGIAQLPVARSEIQSLQGDWQAARDAEIEALLKTAEQHLNEVPLTSQPLEQALKTYQEVLSLDPEKPRARAGTTVSESLIEALSEIERDDFDSADKALSSARLAAGNVKLWNNALEETARQLAEARKDLLVSQTRSSARRLLEQAAERLLATPLNGESLPEANRLFQEAQALSREMVELEAEAKTASAGSEFVATLQNTKQQLDKADFKAARANLNSGKTRSRSYSIGLGDLFLAKAEQKIALAEIEWNLAQTKALLSKNLLDKGALDGARRHLKRVQTLDAEHAVGVNALRAIKPLQSVAYSRQDHDYKAAINALQEAQPALVALGIPASVFESTNALIRSEQEAWAAEQRKNAIATRLADAFDVLQRSPFDSASWKRAETLFSEVSSIEGGAGQADSGRGVLAALQAASAATNTGRFDDAQAQIIVAEKILLSFGIGRLDEARNLVEAANREWQARKQRMITDALASAEQILGKQAPSAEVLQQTRQSYDKALELDPDQKQAQAGLAVIASLEAFLQSLQANEFDKAQQQLAEAESTAQSAHLSPRLLEGASKLLSDQREAWNTDQARQQIVTLQQRVSGLLGQQGIPDERLALAEKALQEATVLSQSHRGLETYTVQTTSGLEVIILLRAVKGELEQAQFDAASKTLSEIQQRLKEAELDPAILKNASNIAVSAEIDWRLADAARSLSRGVELLKSSVDLDSAEANYTAIKELAPDHAEIESGLHGVATLRKMKAARTRHDYDEAMPLLDEATTELSGLGVANDAFNPVRQKLTREQQHWNTLTRERDLNAWTSKAIGAMNRTPFTDATWKTVDALADKIMAASANDERGVAIRGALAGIRQAKKAIDAERFDKARVHIKKAQFELVAIGVRHPLVNVDRLLDLTLNEALQKQLELAGAALEEDPLSEAAMTNAKSALQRVLKFLPDYAVAKAGVSVINLVQESEAAIAVTEFAKSAMLLDDADKQLRPLETRDTPVPQLSKLLADAKRELAQQRPSPSEIYPRISLALQAITIDPLGTGMLDTADKLLRNVLSLQADEPTALASLQAIDHLRSAESALTEGANAEARAALTQAEELLVDVGLSRNVLRTAWQKLEETTE